MAKALKLNPDEVDYLLGRLERAKFGLDENEKRIMCIELRERLQGVKTGTEPMFPASGDPNDEE